MPGLEVFVVMLAFTPDPLFPMVFAVCTMVVSMLSPVCDTVAETLCAPSDTVDVTVAAAPLITSPNCGHPLFPPDYFAAAQNSRACTV
jgi:hypothetical protein